MVMPHRILDCSLVTGVVAEALSVQEITLSGVGSALPACSPALSTVTDSNLLGHALYVKTFQTSCGFIILTSQIKAKLSSFRGQPMP